MNDIVSYSMAKEIMGENMIGIEELSGMSVLSFAIPQSIPDIPFSRNELNEKRNDYYLILGLTEFSDSKYITIRNMIDVFGKNAELSEPCFYNQDWYDNEEFIDRRMESGWFLIRKNVYEDSRSVQPYELMKKYTFPSAIRCCYSFFVLWLSKGEKLWYHDFVWCSDTDHNGDRIYVGKYNDIDGINKNGFSIHRHLGLRSCYGCVD